MPVPLDELSNELLRFSADRSPFDAEQVVLVDMLASIGQTEDVKFNFGSGSQAEPLGIVNQVVAGNRFAASASVTVANVVADLNKAMTLLSTGNIRMLRPAWLWSPRTTNFLMTLLDANGHFVFSNEIEQGGLFRWPFFQNNNIPSNLGAGTDESLIILAGMAEVVFGDVASVKIARSDTATINGVNLFERDQQAIRPRQWNDIELRHTNGSAVIEQVKCCSREGRSARRRTRNSCWPGRARAAATFSARLPSPCAYCPSEHGDGSVRPAA